jgi:hypothetical protein
VAERKPLLAPKKAEEPFSVVALVRQMTARSQRGRRPRLRGRPRKEFPKLLDQKKIMSSIKKELGLR